MREGEGAGLDFEEELVLDVDEEKPGGSGVVEEGLAGRGGGVERERAQEGGGGGGGGMAELVWARR